MKAIVSDLHANMAAIEAVLKDIRSHGISDDDTICLGDIVGYGPQPVEAVDVAMGFRINMMGNHDEAVIYEPHGFNFRALTAIRWTKKKLETGLFHRANKKRLEFLKALKITYREDGVFFVHGSPREPTTEYILRGDCEDANLGRNETKMPDIFGRFDGICCVGHTHIPSIIEQHRDENTANGWRFEYKNEKEVGYQYVRKDGIKAVLNVGAVGQPRDGDTRACYVIWDGDRFTWRRVEYDVKKTVSLIRKVNELDEYNADRLEMGI